MSENNTELPSETRLAELREAGIVPYSPFSSACFLALGAGVGCYLTFSSLHALLDAWRAAAGRSAPELTVLLEEPAVAREVTRALLFPPLGAFLACILWGLFQTRLALRPQRLAFNPARLNPFSRTSPAPRIMRFLYRVLVLCGLAAGAAIVFVRAVPAALVVLNRSPGELARWAVSLAAQVAPLVALTLAALAFFAWLAGRVTFMLRHRMSRAEIEREARER